MELIDGNGIKGNMNYEFIALQKTDLAQKIAMAFNQPLHQVPLMTFADGELNIVLKNPEQYAKKTVIIIQSTGHPVNQLVLDIAFLAHELKNAGASKVIAVIPYFGYSRQAKSNVNADKSGCLAVIAQLFENAGIDEIVTIDVHDGEMQHLFSIKCHNLSVQPFIAAHKENQNLARTNACLIAPDEGIGSYVKMIADKIGMGMVNFHKERFAPDQTRIITSNGECKGTIGIVIDDIIATGGTAINVANALAADRYQSIYGYFIHPVFAADAGDEIKKSVFKTIYVGNTIPLPIALQDNPKIKQFDVSPVIINALKKIVG